MKSKNQQIKELTFEVNCRIEHGVDDPHVQYIFEKLKQADATPVIQDHKIALLINGLVDYFGGEIAAYWNAQLVQKGLEPIYDSGDIRSRIKKEVIAWIEAL